MNPEMEYSATFGEGMNCVPMNQEVVAVDFTPAANAADGTTTWI